MSSIDNIRRRWFNRAKIYRIIFSVLLFSSAIYSEVFYCYEASYVINDYCLIKNQICSFIDTANFLIFNICFPPSLMLDFSVAMLMNIKQTRQRVEHIQTINRINRRDKQLMSMLLVQVNE